MLLRRVNVELRWRQGGIGKTTVSTYLVHEEGTRKRFERVVWVALGQEPNLAQLQESVHVQLTGQAFDGQPTAEEKLEALRQAMAGKDVLLVLDDLWEAEHERLFNVIDEASSVSKVLISSRVRGVLEGAEVVDVGLPTEAEAVEMLLSVAGLAVDVVPAKALEVVRFCNCLPLTIGMAGKLVHEIRRDGLMDGELEWGGVVELLEEEFSEGGQHRSMEERIIRTSLRAIKGPHRKNVIRLFHALAIVPEDTRVPIEVVRMLFEAESETGLGAAAPSLLSIRRWL